MIDAVIYGVTPRAKYRNGAEVSARKQVKNAKQRPGNFAPDPFELRLIDARCRNMGTQSDKPPRSPSVKSIRFRKLRDLEHVLDGAKKLLHMFSRLE